MTYLWIKSFHIGAVLVFTGGLMLLAVVTSRWVLPGEVLLPHEKHIGHAVLQWDRHVTVPSMAAVWALGLGLAVWGSWMGQSWMWGKMVLVVSLSGLHGILSAMLRRRMGSAQVSPSPWLRYAPVAVAACSVAIAILVTVKP